MPVQNIILPVWNRAPTIVRAVQGEANSRTISVTLKDAGGQSVDLSGASAHLYIQNPDGMEIFLDGTVPNSADGVCCFTLTSGATAVPGIAQCQILILWQDNRSLKVVGLSLEIIPSNLDGAVESADEFSALVTVLNKAEAVSDTMTQVAASTKQVAADAQTAVTAANAAVSTANSASEAANGAASDANQAVLNAARLYQMVNPLTGQLAYVTDVVNGLTSYIFRTSVMAREMDGLNKAAQDCDALTVSAVTFDTDAKTELGVS